MELAALHLDRQPPRRGSRRLVVMLMIYLAPELFVWSWPDPSTLGELVGSAGSEQSRNFR